MQIANSLGEGSLNPAWRRRLRFSAAPRLSLAASGENQPREGGMYDAGTKRGKILCESC